MAAINYTQQPLHSIQEELMEAIATLEQSQSEEEVTQAYARLKQSIGDLFQRTGELQRQFYQQRNTILTQAKRIADLEFERILQPGPPSPPAGCLVPHPCFPEAIAVTQSPDFFFIHTSFGLVNIRHITLLDEQTKTLHLVGGSVRQLQDGDLQRIRFTLKLYQPS